MSREITDYNTSKALVKIALDILNVRKATYTHKWDAEVINIKRGTGVTNVGIALGTPVGYSGRKLLVKNSDASATAITLTAPVVTLVDGTTYQSTIDGATTVAIAKNYGSVEIVSDGEDFMILAQDLT